MTRDYRHGPARRQPYQRRSQRQANASTPTDSDSKTPARSSTQSEKPASSGPPALRWWLLALALTVALLVGFWVVNHFAQNHFSKPAPTTQPATQASHETTAAQSASQPTTQPLMVEALPNPHRQSEGPKKSGQVAYTFYQGLAQTEVVVEAMPVSVALSVPHYIQAGSFGAKRYALQEQARLARFDQTLTLSKLTTDKGTYFRLRMGPFQDRLELNKQRNVLRRLGVDTLIVRDRSATKNQSSDPED